MSIIEEITKQENLAAIQLVEESKKIINQSNNDLPIYEVTSNDYETIMQEIQIHEQQMEHTVKHVDEISNALKERIMEYLAVRSERSAILFKGIPEILSVAASMYNTSVMGRSKIAALKKMRADIIKNSKSGKNGEVFDLTSFLTD